MLKNVWHLVYDNDLENYVLIQTDELGACHQVFWDDVMHLDPNDIDTAKCQRKHFWSIKWSYGLRVYKHKPQDALFRFYNPDDPNQANQAKLWHEKGEHLIAMIADDRRTLPAYATAMICYHDPLSFIKMLTDNIASHLNKHGGHTFDFYAELCVLCEDFQGVYHGVSYRANGDERIFAVITQIKAKMPSTDTPLWWVQANSLTKDEKNELIELIYAHRVRPLGLPIADGLFESMGDDVNSDELVVNLMYRVSGEQ